VSVRRAIVSLAAIVLVCGCGGTRAGARPLLLVADDYRLEIVDARTGTAVFTVRGQPFLEGHGAIVAFPSARWSTDGNQLAYVRESTPSLQDSSTRTVHIVDARTWRELARFRRGDVPLYDRWALGATPHEAPLPAVSTTGSWLAYRHLGDLVVARTDGTGARVRLVSAAPRTWSPDGRRLVAQRTDELWVVDPTGAARLLRRRPLDARLQWQPSSHGVPVEKGHVPASASLGPSPLPAQPRALPNTTAIHLVDIRVSDVSREGHEPHLAQTRWLRPREIPVVASADRRRLVVARGRTLSVVDTLTGAHRLVARDTLGGYATLLPDGRIAYLDRRHRLVLAGRRRVVTPLRIPAEGALAAFAVDPSGTHALYTRSCDVWIADLRTGRSRVFARPQQAWPGAVALLSPEPDSWSPDGRTVALARTFSACDGTQQSLDASGVLFTAAGKPVASLPGCRFDWRRDGRALLVQTCIGAGTEVGYLQQEYAVDVRRRRIGLVVHSPLWDVGFRRDGRVVAQAYGRRDGPDAPIPVRTFTARLVLRAR
jgi:hypothetical protein